MKKIQFLSIVLSLLLLTATSCNKKAEETQAAGEPAQPAFDSATARATVEESYREFEKAFNAKDSVALANCYTADAKFMAPNEKAIVGRPALQKTFHMWFSGDMPTIKLNCVEVWGSADNIISENSWTMTGKDGKVVDAGKSLEVYKREDGKWKMARDCFNSDMPLPPPPPPAPKK